MFGARGEEFRIGFWYRLRDRGADLVAAPITPVSILEATVLASRPDLVLAVSGCCAGIALLSRRRWPLMMPLAALSIIAVASIGAHHAFWQSNALVFALLLSAWTLGRELSRRPAIVGGILGLLLAAVHQVLAPAAENLNSLFALAALAGCWAAGAGVRQRAELARELSDRTDLVASSEAAEVRQSIANERRRIARELHDVISHSVTVMALQAGGARMLIDQDARRALAAILATERAGREALVELRRMGTVISDGEPAVREPEPGLASLDGLVEHVRSAGLALEMETRGKPVKLDPGLDLTAYRILQEALTNALRHGDGQARGSIRYLPDELLIEVVNTSNTAFTGSVGRGLLGMRERAELYSGSLEAGGDVDGSFVLCARLPTNFEPL